MINRGDFRVMIDTLGTVGDHTGLVLLDKAGKTRAGLATNGDDTTLTLYDKAGKQRAVLGNDELDNTATGSTEHRATSSLVLFKLRWSRAVGSTLTRIPVLSAVLVRANIVEWKPGPQLLVSRLVSARI